MEKLLTKEEWQALPKDDPRRDISYFMEYMSQEQFDILFKDVKFETPPVFNKIIYKFQHDLSSEE